MLVVLAVIAMAANFAIMGVVSDTSRRLAGVYAQESLNNFEMIMLSELTLIRNVAEIPALANWMDSEQNTDLQLLALQQLRHAAASFANPELYIVVHASGNQYSLNVYTPQVGFRPHSTVLPHVTTDQWYFDLIGSGQPFLYNIDRDDLTGRWRIWINHVVLRHGRMVGAVCASFYVDEILPSLFRRTEEGYTRGLIVDPAGYVHIDSFMDGHAAYVLGYMPHITDIHAALGGHIRDTRTDNLFFTTEDEMIIVGLVGGGAGG
jgi:hypothetical protein